MMSSADGYAMAPINKGLLDNGCYVVDIPLMSLSIVIVSVLCKHSDNNGTKIIRSW